MRSTFSFKVGAILTAASVIINASECVGTSITKQWLTRRTVRSPLSLVCAGQQFEDLLLGKSNIFTLQELIAPVD